MKTLLALIVVLVLSVVSYKIGRSNGFNQGWDKGFIRGEQSELPDLYESSQDERDTLARASGHSKAFYSGFDYCARQIQN